MQCEEPHPLCGQRTTFTITINNHRKGHHRQFSYYEFTTDGPCQVTILWAPDNPGGVLPHHTGNEDPVTLPPHITVLPIPKDSGGYIESYPAPEERSFRDYILVLPIPDIPPIYIYLSAPPVEPLEVGEYGNLTKRSVKDGIEVDHIPSQGALRIYLKNQTGGLLTDEDISKMLQKAPAVAIPGNLHRDYSDTYAGRNNKIEDGLTKRARDARDIRAAVRLSRDVKNSLNRSWPQV